MFTIYYLVIQPTLSSSATCGECGFRVSVGCMSLRRMGFGESRLLGRLGNIGVPTRKLSGIQAHLGEKHPDHYRPHVPVQCDPSSCLVPLRKRLLTTAPTPRDSFGQEEQPDRDNSSRSDLFLHKCQGGRRGDASCSRMPAGRHWGWNSEPFIPTT